MSFYQYLIKRQINSKLVLFILGVLLTGTICLVGQKYLSLKEEVNNLTKTEAALIERIAREVAQENVVYIINFGNGNVKSYRVVPDKDSTVFSLLNKLSKEENFPVNSTFYKDMGILVESIDGIQNGTDNKYWQYWVNGDLPMVAADKKEVKANDKIEWRFAPSNF